MNFVLITTNRETGETQTQEFETREERLQVWSRLNLHTHSYRFEEDQEDAP